jgi:hypothetical protein
VYIDDTTGYLSKGQDGLEIVDLSDPAAVEPITAVSGMDVRDTAVLNELILLATGKGGLVIGTFSDNRFNEVSRLEDLYALKVTVEGDTAFVVATEGVAGVGLSDPVKPELISFYKTSSCEDITVAGRYAYLAEGYLGLTILDISNPALPLKVSVCEELFAFGVDVDTSEEPASYAFVTDSQGLNIVEIHVPAWLMQ